MPRDPGRGGAPPAGGLRLPDPTRDLPGKSSPSDRLNGGCTTKAIAARDAPDENPAPRLIRPSAALTMGSIMVFRARPVDAWHTAPFGKLQALPEKGKAVTTW